MVAAYHPFNQSTSPDSDSYLHRIRYATVSLHDHLQTVLELQCENQHQAIEPKSLKVALSGHQA